MSYISKDRLARDTVSLTGLVLLAALLYVLFIFGIILSAIWLVYFIVGLCRHTNPWPLRVKRPAPRHLASSENLVPLDELFPSRGRWQS